MIDDPLAPLRLLISYAHAVRRDDLLTDAECDAVEAAQAEMVDLAVAHLVAKYPALSADREQKPKADIVPCPVCLVAQVEDQDGEDQGGRDWSRSCRRRGDRLLDDQHTGQVLPATHWGAVPHIDVLADTINGADAQRVAHADQCANSSPCSSGTTFAQNVAAAIWTHGQDDAAGGITTISAYSPTTKQWYSMRCVAGDPTVCRGGNNAVVEVWGPHN